MTSPTLSGQPQGVGDAFGPGSHASHEIWLPIDGYARRYEVSSLGRVRSLRGCRILSSVPTKDGYGTVKLSNGRKETRHRINRLVCTAFHGTPQDGWQAAHLNGIRSDCSAGNLAWKTPKANTADKIAHGTHQTGEKHPRARLSADQVEEIRARAKDGVSASQIGRDFGIHNTTAGQIIRGERWS